MIAKLSEREKALIRRAANGGPVTRFLMGWMPFVVMGVCLLSVLALVVAAILAYPSAP